MLVLRNLGAGFDCVHRGGTMDRRWTRRQLPRPPLQRRKATRTARSFGRGRETASRFARSPHPRPRPRPLSRTLRGRGVTRATGCRSGNEFSPLREERAGRGRGRSSVRVRDARPQGRDTGALARARRHASRMVSAGGSAPLGTVVSCPTARAARPGAQRRDTPRTAVRKCGSARVRKCESARVAFRPPAGRRRSSRRLPAPRRRWWRRRALPWSRRRSSRRIPSSAGCG